MNQAEDLKSLCWRNSPQPDRENWGEGPPKVSKALSHWAEVAVPLMGTTRPQLLQEPRPKKWLPAFSTNAHCMFRGCLEIRTISTPTGFLTFSAHDPGQLHSPRMGQLRRPCRAEFWDLCIWHKFQEVNTLPALSKS